MNKRISTLMVALLAAGSFSSAFAELDADRKVALEDFKTGRYYYLAGTHKDNGKTYLQALTAEGRIEENAVTAENPLPKAQWTVVKSTQGLYSFADENGKFLAFKKGNDGAYTVETNKDKANEEKALRWFILTEKGYLQLQNVEGALYLGLTKPATGDWYTTVVPKNVAGAAFIKAGITLYEAYNTAVTPGKLREVEGDNFSLDFSDYATLQGDTTFTNNDIKVVTVNGSPKNSFYLMVEGEDKDGAFTLPADEDKFKAAKFIYATKKTVTNNLNDKDLTGYRYDVISGADFNKAVADRTLDPDNALFYAYTSLNQKGYIFEQKDINGKTGTVWIDKVDAANEVSYVATRDVNVHTSPMVIEVGHGTRVAASAVANAKTKVVNVVAANSNGVFAQALGLEDNAVKLYAKGSEAMKNYPAGQWLVAAGTADNTIQLINIQNLASIDNIALYATDKEGVYKVKANGSALDGQTIKLETAASYSQENGYFHAENVKGQTYTFTTTVGTLVGGEDVNVYLKGDAAKKVVFGTPYEDRATEWTLARAAKATEYKSTYKYYEGTSLKESKDEVIRKGYTYTIAAAENSFISDNYKLGAELAFYLRQVAKDAYVIAWSDANVNDGKDYGKVFGSYGKLIKTTNKENDYTLGNAATLADATTFEIAVVQPFASYPADSKWVTVSDVLGKYVSADKNDAAVLAKDPLPLYIDSVNAEDATPNFFLSQNGKMMVDGEYIVKLAEEAYENDEISKKEHDAKVATTTYNSITRVMFTEAARVNSQDSIQLAGAEEAIKTPSEFKFQILDVDGEYVLYNLNGGFVNVLNGNLVFGSFDSVETFVIEDTEAPTANDDVTVATVKVIAGEGQVTIVGAAGKKVVVSNILGQVVANTVLSSDNATIAAPAGVVVVAVEGEAAVKAVVK